MTSRDFTSAGLDAPGSGTEARVLSPEERAEIQEELAVLPVRSAACVEALQVVQRHRGWVSDDAVKAVADFLEMDPAQVDSVATFYNLVFRKPVGRHVILLCDSVSCWVEGYDALRQALEKRLGVVLGQTTADGRFTLLPICCLGTCDHAPALMVDGDLHQNVELDDLAALLEPYE